MISVLERQKRRRHRNRKSACEDGGRGQSGAAPRQGKLRVVGSRQKPGERSGTGSPSEPPEGNKSADILGFGLLASRTVREQNLIVLISSVCGNLLQYS
jgi:hypothetical protein